MDTPEQRDLITTVPDGLVIIELDGDLSEALRNPIFLHALSTDVIPEYLQKRRWFASKGERMKCVSIASATPMKYPADVILCELDVELDGHTETYLLPLTIVWDDAPPSALVLQLALSRVRQGLRMGVLTDGFATEAMAKGLVAGLSDSLADHTTLESLGTQQLQALELGDATAVHWLSAEQSNSSLILGGVAIIKLIRHIFPGVHPEVEMTRFLTSRGYRNTAPFFGEVALTTPDGDRHTLIIAQGAINNQGDGWGWMLTHLRTALDRNVTEDEAQRFKPLLDFLSNVGTRLGELHVTLAQPTDEDDFCPLLAGPSEVEHWRSGVIDQLNGALYTLSGSINQLEAALATRIRNIFDRKDRLLATITDLSGKLLGAKMIRNHGDFHLGQILVADGDAYIIDFEGEPSRSIAERRAKTSPLRDVAGLVRSLDYLAATALLDHGTVEADHETRSALISSFAAEAEKRFLASYLAKVETSTALHMTAQDFTRLLDLFLLQKAAYEIDYEAGNRPDWLAIPSRGFADVAERLLEIAQ